MVCESDRERNKEDEKLSLHVTQSEQRNFYKVKNNEYCVAESEPP
jgi:hypothetical protein